MTNNSNLETITACPHCYAKKPGPPRNFLACEPNKPGVVICKVHGEMPITDELRNGPKFYFSHYEQP